MIANGDKKKAKEIQDKYVHTIGNLTLTGYNSKLSNFSFEKKRDRVNKENVNVGYKNGLFLNEDLKNEDIRSYLTYLLKEKAISTSGMNQAYSSLKIIYTMTTHLLEDGTDIFTIKELLGHSSIKTTTIYLHASNKHIKSIKDPLNFLNRED